MTSVLELLGSLVDQSLVQPEEREGATRYRMLETVREYALAKLRASDEEHRIRSRHLGWLRELARTAEPHLRGAEQGRWLDRLEAERDNIRDATTWEGLAAERRLELAVSVATMWNVRGHWTEGRERLSHLIDRGRSTAPAGSLAQALLSAGILTQNQGDHPAARILFDESLAIARRLDDKRAVASALNYLAILAQEQGRYQTAQALYEENLAIDRELGDENGIAYSLGNLGLLAQIRGDPRSARALLTESLERLRALGDRRGIAFSHINLGMLDYEEGDLGAARARFEASLDIQRELGDRRWVASSLHNLAGVAWRQDDRAGSVAMMRECLAIQRELGEGIGLVHSLANLSTIELELGELASARASSEEALLVAGRMGAADLVALSLDASSAARAAGGDLDVAARLHGAADAVRTGIGAHRDPEDEDAATRRVSALRDALGAERFDEAYALGAAMSPEEAVAEALG